MLLWSWCIFFSSTVLLLLHRHHQHRRLRFSLSLKVKAINCLRQQKEELYVAAYKSTRAITFFAGFGVSKLENHCLNTRCFCIMDLDVEVQCDSNKRHTHTIPMSAFACFLIIDFSRFFFSYVLLCMEPYLVRRDNLFCHSTFVSIFTSIINDLLLQSNRSKSDVVINKNKSLRSCRVGNSMDLFNFRSRVH